MSGSISSGQQAHGTLASSSALLAAGDKKAGYGKLQDLVTNLLKEQGIVTTADSGDGGIGPAALTAAVAQELVAEDGYFGVEKTSQDR